MMDIFKGLSGSQRKQIGWTTGVAVALFFILRMLPGAVAPERPGQFLARAGATDERVEMCDVSNLGFSVVNNVVSPVRLNARPLSEPVQGEPVQVVLSLETLGGKAITFDDILESHEEKVHLLVVDPSLRDYHHKHPQPSEVRGEYVFTFVPRASGEYRLFAEFSAARTGRPVNAVTNLAVPGEASQPVGEGRLAVDKGDYHFELLSNPNGYRSRRPQELRVRVSHRHSGEPVILERIMGEYAHLVGFDVERSGFTHMHPLISGTDYSLDPVRPEVGFMLQVSEPGFYKIWAQFKIGGEQVFVPFGLTVSS